MSAQKRFRATARRGGERLILELEGELDMASAHLLDAALADASLDDSCTAVVLDLNGIQFADSTGLKAIFRVRKAVLDGGRRFAVTQGSRQMQRLLSLTRLDEHLQTLETAESELG